MKKTVSAILCAAFSLCAFAGCTHDVEEEVQKDFSAYSQVWRASQTSVKHDVGDLSVDSGWGAIPQVDKAGVLCEVETQTLYKTAYTAAARLLVNDLSSASNPVKDVACVLRVVDDKGIELGRRNVRVAEFDEKLTYKDFEFTFPVDKESNASFQVYWPGTSYVRISEFGIMSKTNQDLEGIDFAETGKRLLGTEIEEENNIEYEESALYYFDLFSYMNTVALDAEEQYDIANLVSTLQGLVNRDGQRLFIRFQESNNYSEDTDGFWLRKLTGEGAWLDGKKVVTVKSPMTLLNLFERYYTGFAAWDPAVPATVNAVATACGVENLLPVRYSAVRNSVYWYVKNADEFADKSVKVDLGGKFMGEGTVYGTEAPSTGSRKNDVYIWAKETYLDTHKTNSHMMAYHVDAYGSNTVFAAYGDLQNMYLSNRDYYIANKAFFFDLSVMEFEIPDDDPDQSERVGIRDGSIDYLTFEKIMKAQAAWAEEADASKPIDVGGFTPWHLKYTKYTNPDASGEVTCEWETVYQFSIYNASINADAPHYTAMSNASIYEKYPMQDSYKQTGKQAVTKTVDPQEHLPTGNEQGANYLIFFMGDFDASSWLNTAMIKFWADANRGKIPLCWPFSLDISKRAGHVIDMMYATATENDYFVAGDNGTGYLNPESFADSSGRHEGIYGGLDEWAAYNKAAYERFDIDYTGFLITRNAATKDILDCYAKFCKGVALNKVTSATAEGLSVALSNDYAGNVNEFVKGFSEKKAGDSSTFRQIRFILRSPTDVFTLYNELQSPEYAKYNFKVVDPYTFYGLLEQQGNMG